MGEASAAKRLRTAEDRLSGAHADPDLNAFKFAPAQHTDAPLPHGCPKPGPVVLPEQPESGAFGGRGRGCRERCLLAALRHGHGGVATGFESHIHFGEQRTKLTNRNPENQGAPRARPVKEHRAGTPFRGAYSE
jgi:hypothetical protein